MKTSFRRDSAFIKLFYAPISIPFVQHSFWYLILTPQWPRGSHHLPQAQPVLSFINGQRWQSGEQCTGKAWRNPFIVAVTTQIFLNIHGDHPANQPGVWLIPLESWESLTIAEPCGDGGLFPPGGDRVSQPRHETWGQGTRSCYCHSHGGPACHHPTGQLGFWKQIYCTEFSAPLEGSWTSVQALVSCLWEGSQFWARSAYFPFSHPELWVSVNSDEFPNVFMGYFPWYSWTVGMEVTMSGYGYWPCPWLCVKPRPRDRSPQEDPAV